MKENSELFSRNRRYVLDTWTKGSQLSQWGSRARMESWGQARVGTTTTKEGPEGHGLGGSIGNVHSRESFSLLLVGRCTMVSPLLTLKNAKCTLGD